jgi:hypothetical protein
MDVVDECTQLLLGDDRETPNLLLPDRVPTFAVRVTRKDDEGLFVVLLSQGVDGPSGRPTTPMPVEVVEQAVAGEIDEEMEMVGHEYEGCQRASTVFESGCDLAG